MPYPQIGVGGTLVDAEKHLSGVYRVRQCVQPVVLLFAAFQPPQRPFAGGLGVVIGRGVFHAFVKGHGDVAAQIALDTHTLLRTHEDAVSVQVAGKRHALLLDLSQPCQREHLKAAAVGEDGAIPAHELMKSSHLPHHIVAGAQVQVIGVG